MITMPRRWIVRSCPVEALGRDPKNPNSMPPAMRAKLGRAIQAVGMLQPLLVRRLPGAIEAFDDLETPAAQAAILRLGLKCFEIIDGHHRLDEAVAGGATEVPIVAIDCDQGTARVIQLEMNRLHGELDLSLVAINFAELESAGMSIEDMTLSAFDPDEIAALMKSLQASDASEEIMNGGAGQNDVEEPEQAPKPFELTIGFKTAKDMKAVRKVLAKHAGGGKRPDLTTGLLRLAGVEPEPT